MTARTLDPRLEAALEFGPVLGFVVAYLIFRNDSFVIFGTEYSGFVTVTAAFIPVFLLGIGTLWALAGRLTRLQIATALMLIVFGGLSVWFNDPSLFKMKPTAIYLLLTLILGIGLLRGQSWLKYVLDEMIPLKKKGWMILTKRMTLLFFLAALANELVWRTQSEAFWVIFETLAMPIVILVLCLTQIPLVVEYAAWPSSKKKQRGKGARSRAR